MLKMVDGTGIIGVDMICPLGVSAPQPPNYDRVELEGAGMLVLPNSLKAPLERVELIGNSTHGENPTPEALQEIKSVGKYNEDTGKYLCDLKVTGKNLFNMADIQSGNGKIESSYTTAKSVKSFRVIKDRKYLLISKGTMIVDTVYSSIHFGKDDLEYMKNHADILSVGLGYKIFIGEETRTILTAKETCTITKVLIHGTKNAADAYEAEELGLFEIVDDNANINYEPYTEQSVQIALDEPLQGIGEYKDTVTKDGVVRRIKQITVDEKSNLIFYSEGKNTIAYLVKVNDATPTNYIPSVISDRFRKVQYIDNNDTNGVVTLFGKQIIFRVSKEIANGIDALKEWLVNNNITFNYVLETPTTEPLPESVQQQLQALHSENGTTHVFVDSGEVPCGIKLTYRKEK